LDSRDRPGLSTGGLGFTRHGNQGNEMYGLILIVVLVVLALLLLAVGSHLQYRPNLLIYPSSVVFLLLVVAAVLLAFRVI
jgi:hypothetical protein